MANALLWDFFGPRAEPTARHHAEHVRGFLATHGIQEFRCEVVVAPSHVTVRCVVPDSSEESVARALRPRRLEPISEPSRSVMDS